MLRIFTLRPDLNPQTWVPEPSMLTTRPPKPSRLVGFYYKKTEDTLNFPLGILRKCRNGPIYVKNWSLLKIFVY